MKNLNALIALFMMAVVSATQAHAQVVTVESAIDQLNYALSVQWDQKDQAFKRQAIAHFASELDQLQKAGVSNEKIMTGLMAKMPDAQTAKDVQGMMKLAQARNLSAAETNRMVLDYVQKAQTTGASWSDAATVAVVLVSIAVIVTIVILSSRHGGSSSSSVNPTPDPTPTLTTGCFRNEAGVEYCYQ